jgi:hypothetical protein
MSDTRPAPLAGHTCPICGVGSARVLGNAHGSRTTRIGSETSRSPSRRYSAPRPSVSFAKRFRRAGWSVFRADYSLSSKHVPEVTAVVDTEEEWLVLNRVPQAKSRADGAGWIAAH